MSHRSLLAGSGVFSLLIALAGCGAGDSVVGGKGGADSGSADSVVDAGWSGPKTCDPSWMETCDGVDNDCDGKIDEDYDVDADNYSTCGSVADCNDNDATVHPNATELKNAVDDDCDGKIDLGAPDVDYDQDGTPFPADCNDDEKLVGPNAIEVAGDGTDNNCNGAIDEAMDCESGISGSTANDFLRAMGICGAYVQTASFVTGNGNGRAIRGQFGSQYMPKEGTKFVQLSSGAAVDNLDQAGYRPQDGTSFGGSQAHPLWSRPKCGPTGTTAPAARDLTELKITMKVPQNAQSFSYQLNFFSAEYPEYVCTQYNDRFIALLQSTALDPSKLPGGTAAKAANCTSSTTTECNISFDANGQPLTINNGFFSVCESYSGLGAQGQQVNNTCAPNTVPLLAKTGYDLSDAIGNPIGGGTGWLTTKAPVTPGETITLRFIILDEGDTYYDSAVLLDNFKWDLQEVTAPETSPIG